MDENKKPAQFTKEGDIILDMRQMTAAILQYANFNFGGVEWDLTLIVNDAGGKNELKGCKLSPVSPRLIVPKNELS